MQEKSDDFSNDISELIDRLEEFREELGVSQQEFSRILQVSKSSYNEVVGEKRRKPSLKMIFAAIKRGYLNPVWLFTGMGETTRKASEDPEAIQAGLYRPDEHGVEWDTKLTDEEAYLISLYRRAPPHRREGIVRSAEGLARPDDKSPGTPGKSAPAQPRKGAGSGTQP